MFAGFCDGESRDLQRGAGGVRQLRRARPPPQDRGLLHPALPAQVPTPRRKYFLSKSKYFPLSRIFTLSFRSFSPVPNTLEFHPGQDYFFISGSDYCTSHNMKVMFKVLDSDTVRENVEKIGDNRG